MRKIIVTILMFAIMLQIGLVSAQARVEITRESAFLGNYIDRLTYIGVVRGDANGELRLDQLITRAEVCAIIARISGYEPVDTNLPFVDVPKEHWAYSYINFAYQRELTNGISAEHFAPEEHVTYAQILQFISNALGYQSVFYGIGFPTSALFFRHHLDVSMSIEYADAFAPRDDVFKLLNQALDREHFSDTLRYGRSMFLWDKMGYERIEIGFMEYDEGSQTLKVEVHNEATGEIKREDFIVALRYQILYNEIRWAYSPAIDIWVDNGVEDGTRRVVFISIIWHSTWSADQNPWQRPNMRVR